MNLKTFFFLLLFPALLTYSQEVPIGQWREHLSYNKAVSITQAGSTIYTASANGIISFDYSDGEIKFLSRVETLSDIGINTISYNNSTNTLVIGYNNGNVDLVGEKTINISAIKNSSITGNKTINSILNIGEFAYLSCGFGIVVIDTKKNEVKDTYIIGAGGVNTSVNKLIVYENNFYAATETGVFRADVNSNFLNDFNSWTLITDLPDPTGNYNSIAYSTNQVLVSYEGESNPDTLYQFNGVSWSKIPNIELYQDVRDIYFLNNKYLVNHFDSLSVIEPSTLLKEASIKKYTDFWELSVNDIIFTNNNYYIADDRLAMATVVSDEVGSIYAQLWKAPYSNTANDIDILDNQLWGGTGFVTGGGWSPTYSADGGFHYDITNDTWTLYPGNCDPIIGCIRDVIGIVIDPSNPKKAYGCGFSFNSLAEFQDGKILLTRDSSNSALREHFLLPNMYQVAEADFDEDNNLWAANTYVPNPLVVKTADGQWNNFYCGNENRNIIISDIITDKTNNYKWMVAERKHIICYDSGEDPLDPSDDRYKTLKEGAGNGNIHAGPKCIQEDLDGEIWIGTEEGIAIIYNPINVFEGLDFDAQQIKIEQDGNVEFLLSTEQVNTIQVDGGNRKWIGTEASGVFVFSADGQEQIHHFTFENSPLFSNKILDIAINQQSGEVFISTDQGIISYRGIATEGGNTFIDVYAFPNPVQPGYEGPITIKGLMKDSDVRITDLVGNIVYATKSIGGQAVWYGNNLDGNKVKTGIYLVYMVGPEGRKKDVTKILFVD